MGLVDAETFRSQFKQIDANTSKDTLKCQLRVVKGGQDVCIDSVIEDTIIYNSGGPPLDAYTGPLFNLGVEPLF